MSSTSRPSVEQIVARFLEARRAGRRDSIDDVLLALGDSPSDNAARASALRAIVRESRVGGAGARARSLNSSSDVPGIPPAADDDAGALPEMPELEGYDIIDRIGVGGMGVVYEAYQQSTGRRVAVKFMREEATATESSRRRFEREVELVARLQHPGIVSIIDSGAHRGRYFFVMEYVDGFPLDLRFQPGESPVRDVLALMAQVCDAVDYAHQRGVLHRDLKPTNILVDERSQPRLLDFGLAKAIGAGEREREATLSQPGQLLGTLAYMAPEQSRGRTEQLSVRTDVYSLGAIAYELITGKLPCNVDCELAQALANISFHDPARPSIIRKRVNADVDAILLKALEKSPDRRYSTAGELAADIRRHLAGEPITARSAGAPTRALRWVQRNRAVSLVAGLSLATIIALVTVAFFRIAEERDDARASAARAKTIVEMMISRLGKLDPDRGDGEADLDELLAGFAQDITALDSQPLDQAQFRSSLGQAYRNFSDYETAERLFRLALESRRTHLAPASPEIAESLHNYASVLWFLGRYDDAEPLYREALAIRRGRLDDGGGDARQNYALTLDHLSSTLSRRKQFDEAEGLSREVLHLREQLPGDNRLPVARSLNNLATILNERGKHAEAHDLCERSLEILEQSGGVDLRGNVATRHNLAWATFGLGRLAEADSILADVVPRKESIWKPDHDSVATSLHLRAQVRLAMRDLPVAEELAARALDIRRAKLPPTHPDTAATTQLLSEIRSARAERSPAPSGAP